MALSILDGNQSATTLSTILSSGQHITAHTVVSLGTQAITDMRSAVSGSVVSISNLPSTQTIAGTVTANVPLNTDNYTALTGVRVIGVGLDGGLRIQGIDPSNFSPTNLEEGGGIPIFSVNNNNFPISGTVTANAFGKSVIGSTNFPIPIIGYDEDITAADLQITVPVQISSLNGSVGSSNPLPISGTVTIGSALPSGTNRIGVVTIGGGTVTIGAGTAQIGSVTASISNSVVTFYPMQGTTVSNTSFTSLTSSTTLVSAVAMRESLTVFNEGAGNLHISPGATCTTISYQVRLSAGDYWECPAGQLSLAHTAVFATAGTARVTQVS